MMADYKVRARTGADGGRTFFGIDFGSVVPRHDTSEAHNRWVMLNKKTYKKAQFQEFFLDGNKKLHQFSLLASFVRRECPDIKSSDIVKYRHVGTIKEIVFNEKRYMADGQKIKVMKVGDKDESDD